jgi:hypothetical protein
MLLEPDSGQRLQRCRAKVGESERNSERGSATCVLIWQRETRGWWQAVVAAIQMALACGLGVVV